MSEIPELDPLLSEVSLELAETYSDLPTDASRRFASLVDTAIDASHQVDALSGTANAVNFELTPELATLINTEVWGSYSSATTGYVHVNHLVFPLKSATMRRSWSTEVRVDAEDMSRGVYCSVGYDRSTGNSTTTLKLLEEQSPDDYIDRELRGIFRQVAVGELAGAMVRAEVEDDDHMRVAVAEWSELTNPQRLVEVDKRALTDRDVDQLAQYLQVASG